MIAICPPFENRSLIDTIGLGGLASGDLVVTERPAFANDNPSRVEILEWDDAQRQVAAWRDLVAHCLEPNPFLEPAFALSHARQSAVSHRPVFMFVRDAVHNGRLIGVCALTHVHRKFSRIARGWMPKLAALGTPLLDAEKAGEALDIVFGWFARQSPATAGVLFPALPAAGPTAVLIRARAQSLRLEIRDFDAHQRAALPSAACGGRPPESMISTKKMKELRRQRRQLEERGAVTWVSATKTGDVRVAFEKFLALESNGWKGKAGTALVSDPAVATFGRSMTRLLADDCLCRIDALELDGRPVAMGITIISGRSAALWKIAYDEAYAAQSPGVQFILEYTRRQIEDASVDATDSCAIPDHPMINHIWADRLAIVDLFVAVAPQSVVAFRVAADRESRRRGLRAFAKRAVTAARRHVGRALARKAA